MNDNTDPVTRRHTDELVVRIDERTRAMAEELKGLKEIVITRAEFAPIRLAVYGMIGLVLTAVLTAMIATVVTRSGG